MPASVAAKVAWLAAHDRPPVDASAWLLAPRDLVAWRLTGEVATDPTMASRTGLYDLDGQVVGELAGAASRQAGPGRPLRPGQRAADGPSAAAELGLAAGTPVVIGAGDRPCEVLGAGADESVPHGQLGHDGQRVAARSVGRPVLRPPGMVLSRAATGGWLVEGGLSAAGSFLDWLGRLTGHPPADLAELAAGARRGPGG